MGCANERATHRHTTAALFFAVVVCGGSALQSTAGVRRGDALFAKVKPPSNAQRFSQARKDARKYTGQAVDEPLTSLEGRAAQRISGDYADKLRAKKKAPAVSSDGLDVVKDEVSPSGKVKMFGAWLDSGLAGTSASDRQRIIGALEKTRDGSSDEATAGMSDAAKSEVFYAEGVALMNRGEYAKCAGLMRRVRGGGGGRSARRRLLSCCCSPIVSPRYCCSCS
jgi:hypothetical protein